AITAQAITVAQAIVIDTAAALTGSAALASAIGSDIGAMIAAGRVTVANALADIQAADGAYGVNDATNEALLLIAAAGATVGGLQVAVGEAIGALLNHGVIGVSATITAIDGAIGTAGGLSVDQAVSVLIGVAQGSSLQAQVAVGGEFDALVAAGKLGASDWNLALVLAIRATTLSATAGFAVLLSAASNSAALVVPVTNELAALIANSTVVTADQALNALFAGAGAQDFAFMPAGTDATLAAIVTGLVAQNAVTIGQVVADLNTAASGTPVISAKHAVGVLLDLAADTTDPAAAQAYAAALSSLVAGGVGVAALADNLLADVAAGSMSPDQAVAILAGTVGAAPAGHAASLQALIGATLATLVGNGSLTVARLITDLQTAVSNGTLGVNGEVGLIAATASSLSSAVNGSALPGELIRLIESGPSATQVFADIEAVAAAAGVSYDRGFGLLIANIATASDVNLQGAVASELASLVSRSLITGTQAGNYVASAVAAGLSADTAVFVLASIPAPLAAGAGVAALVNSGKITLASALADIQSAASRGTLSVDGEVKLIAALANDLTASGSLNTLSNELIGFVESNTASAAQIFADIAAVAQLSGSYSQSLGVLLAGMGGTADANLQIAVGRQLGSLTASGSITNSGALGDLTAAVSAGQLTGAQAQTIALASISTGGPAMQAAVGQQFGAQLAGQNNAAAVSSLTALITGALAAGTITAGQLTGLLAGMGTAAYSAPNGGSATAAAVVGSLLVSGAFTTSSAINAFTPLAQLGNFETQNQENGPLILKSEASFILTTFLSLNSQVLAGSTTAANASSNFPSDVFDTIPTLDLENAFGQSITPGLNQLVASLGGFGSSGGLVQLASAITSQGISTPDALNVLNSFANSGALTGATQLAALVTGGEVSAAQAMAAVNAVAPYLPATRLVYLLASLGAVPALQSAASGEIANLVQEGSLTASGAVADIAAIIEAAPADDSQLAAISAQTAVDVLLGAFSATQNTALQAAIGQELANIFTNPPAGYSQTAAVAAITGAVTAGQMSPTVATQQMLLLAAAGQLEPTSNRVFASGPVSPAWAAIVAAITGYINAGQISISTLIGTANAASNSPLAATDVGWLVSNVESVAQAITAIVSAEGAQTINASQEASMLLGVYPSLATQNQATATTLGNQIAARQEQVNYRQWSTDPQLTSLVNQLVAADQSALGTLTTLQNDLLGLVSSGAISAQTLIADIEAAGVQGSPQFGALTLYQRTTLLLALAKAVPSATAAAESAITALVTRPFGPSTDPFFSGAPTEAINDVVQMANGTMTLNQAIADVQQYAATHNFDTDAALRVLEQVVGFASPGNNDIPYSIENPVALSQTFITAGTPYLNVDTQSIPTLLSGRIDDGSYDGQLAARAAEGVANNDTTALAPSYAQSLVEGGDLAQIVYETSLATTERVLQYPAGGVLGVFDVYAPGLTLQEVHNVYDTQTSGYIGDQQLVAQITALSSLNSAAARQDVQSAVTSLAFDLTSGYAETNIINELASGQFFDYTDAIAALNDLLAPVMANESAAAAQGTQALAYGWLATKASEYIQGNYQIVTVNGKQTVVVPDTGVPNLYIELTETAPYQTTVLTGLGVISALQGTRVFETYDVAAAYRIAQTIFDIYASGGSNTGNATNDANSAFDAQQPAMAAFLKGFSTVGTVQNGDTGPTTWPGIFNDLKNNGGNVQTYVNVGSRIAAAGVPGVNFVYSQLQGILSEEEATGDLVPNLQTLIIDSVGVEGLSTVVGGVGAAGAVMSLILSIGAVDDVLGTRATAALQGFFGILNQVGNLVGNIIVGELSTVGSVYINAAEDLGNSMAALVTGNLGSFESGAEGLATAYIELADGGFTPQALGAVGSSFGSA
ncbi:MAG TPA: hypothetical protein VN900_09920, partial [Stellaceae bacterium]|nr:hypothetical protein [Stellaceae bacterium]